jgi:hypothetical protein
MINAYKEFMEHTEGKAIKCAIITLGDVAWGETPKTYLLPVGYTDEEFGQFLISLDRNYDNDYFSKSLCGTIWYENGAWSDRQEYDSIEWWAYNSHPSIPNSLL